MLRIIGAACTFVLTAPWHAQGYLYPLYIRMQTEFTTVDLELEFF